MWWYYDLIRSYPEIQPWHNMSREYSTIYWYTPARMINCSSITPRNHTIYHTMALPPDRGAQEFDSTSSAPLPVSQCCTVADLERTLAHLSEQEDAITDRLNALLEMQEDLNRSLSRLDLLRAHLGTQVVAARSLSNEMLSPTSNTASRVSSAVQALDIEQARVKATLEVVEQVVELKACVLGVTGSMGAPQDWETAAAYLHRASKVPKEILEGQFAEEIVPTAEVPDPPGVTLHNAAEGLCGLFLREFEKAAGMNPPDGEKITRFFKLFPLIGRAETGLDVYGKYVCTGISSRARAVLASKPEGGAAGAGAFFYANAITRLFEHIAGIVEQHSPLVERHYGKGKMGRVIARVQREADLQGGIILDAWGEERQVDRRITETKSYAFTFLVQSFLPNARNPGVPGRTASPAAGVAGGGQVAQGDSEGADVREVDMLLLEIGAMLSRWSLYCRFMARKFQVYFPRLLSSLMRRLQRENEAYLPPDQHRNRKIHQPRHQGLHPLLSPLSSLLPPSPPKSPHASSAPSSLSPPFSSDALSRLLSSLTSLPPTCSLSPYSTPRPTT